MKNKLTELDVDFIGGQEPITKEEELAISAFILACKEKRQLQAIRKSKKKILQKVSPAQRKPARQTNVPARTKKVIA